MVALGASATLGNRRKIRGLTGAFLTQVRGRWRRCRWKNLSIDLLYHQQIPFGVCANRVRQLCGDCHVSRSIPDPTTRCLGEPFFEIRGTGLTQNPYSGSVTNLILSGSSILLDRRTTIACALFHTLKQTFSSFVSRSHPLRRSRTCERNGFPRYTITAPAYLA